MQLPFGHSLGGATAAEAMCAGLPIVAGANLDGSLFGEVVGRRSDRPLLPLGANRTDDPTWLDARPHLRRFLRRTGPEHLCFIDLRGRPRRAAQSTVRTSAALVA